MWQNFRPKGPSGVTDGPDATTVRAKARQVCAGGLRSPSAALGGKRFRRTGDNPLPRWTGLGPPGCVLAVRREPLPDLSLRGYPRGPHNGLRVIASTWVSSTTKVAGGFPLSANARWAIGMPIPKRCT